MGQSGAALKKGWQEWVDSDRFQRHDVRGRPKATADRENRLIVRSSVTALESSLTSDTDESHFQLNPDNHRRRALRRPVQRGDPDFTLHATQALNQELWSGVPFRLTAGPLGASLDAHLQHSDTSTIF
ncbi:hypothetical protein TNCV_2014741 [Trichonephila clavipes]|nr:hypothetical protein TNCV_2014741 [Trichonephila clavipes]